MFEDLKAYAKENKVPIIQDGGFEVLFSEITKNGYKSCLEVGTAIGYSAIRMASLGVKVTTIERDSKMYALALENISKYKMEHMIEPVFMDALEYTPSKKFDLIFIDAAKAQSIKFFERFSPFLNDGGEIIVDNLSFHGLVGSEEKLSRSLRQLVTKIQRYIDWIKNNEEWDTTITDKGDGMSISRRK